MDSLPRVGMLCGTVNYWSSWAGGRDRLVATGSLQDSILPPPEALIKLYPLGDGDAPCPSDLMVRRSLIEAGCTFEDALSGPVQMYEDQMFLAKVYLATPVFFSSRVWLDYRQHDQSCVSTVFRDGLYEGMRREFIDWLEAHLRSDPVPGADTVLKAIERAGRELDHPFLGRLRRRARRLLSSRRGSGAEQAPHREGKADRALDEDGAHPR